MPADDPQGLLAEAAARWQRHREVLDFDPGWRIRGPGAAFHAAQEYGHHARWLEWGLADGRHRFAGAPPPPALPELNETNDSWAVEDAVTSPGEARDRCASAWTAYRDEVARLADAVAAPDDRAALREELRLYLVEHFDEHFASMVEGMLEHESEAWARLTAILDAADPDQALHLGDDGAPWGPAGIYVHLQRWMTINIPRAQAFLATGEVPVLEAEVDALNARWIAEDRGIPFADARRDAFLARDRFMAQMRSIPIEKWTARLMGLYGGNSWGHYLEHLEYLQK